MAGINYFDSVASTTSEFINAGASVLYEVAGQNLHGDTLFVQVHDSATPIIAGAIPVYSYQVLDQQTFAFAPPGPLGGRGRRLLLGLQVVYSTAQDTYVAPGAPNAGTFFVAWSSSPA